MSTDLHPLVTSDVKAIRCRLLLELLATRYTGIDLVAARAELDRRLALVGAGVAARYPVAEGAVTADQQARQNALNDRTLLMVGQERARRQFATG